MGHVERLTAGDMAMLAPEAQGWREDIGAIAWLDGPVTLDAVRAVVAARIHQLPRFRQLVRVLPPRFGGPIWIDAPVFDAVDHVGLVELPPSAADADVLRAVEQLRRRPFPPGRPAWGMWLLPGLADGRVALYIKVHHTMVDGVAGLDQVARFLDLTPDAAPGDPQPWAPRPAPTPADLLRDRARSAAALVRRAGTGLLRPMELVRTVARTLAFAASTFGQAPVSVTSLDRVIGPDRRMALTSEDLEGLRAVAHHHAATVNDVLLAAVAGGYRQLLRARGELADDLVLRALVPVSLHTGSGPVDSGNEVSQLFVRLPVGQPDPSARVGVIAQVTGEGKRHVAPLPGGPLWTNRVVQRAIWSRFAHQRWANAYATDLPGPPVPLYLAGARVVRLFPVVPIIGNVAIGVGALSYTGQLDITVVADEDVVPDLDEFVRGLRSTFAELAARVERTG